MNISGFLKNSFIDFPGCVACVVFTSGCNFRCWYCQNYEIISSTDDSIIPESEIFDFLEKRKKFIDGVVVSGGEPTLQADLYDFIKQIKNMGYFVKLDTNGSNPKIIEKLLKDNLLDYVAMDIKTSKEKYEKLACVKVDFNNIVKSVELIKEMAPSFEFRTTFSPDIEVSDFESIASLVGKVKNFSIQSFRPNDCDKVSIPHNRNEFEAAKKILEKNIDNVVLKGI